MIFNFQIGFWWNPTEAFLRLSIFLCQVWGWEVLPGIHPRTLSLRSAHRHGQGFWRRKMHLRPISGAEQAVISTIHVDNMLKKIQSFNSFFVAAVSSECIITSQQASVSSCTNVDPVKRVTFWNTTTACYVRNANAKTATTLIGMANVTPSTQKVGISWDGTIKILTVFHHHYQVLRRWWCVVISRNLSSKCRSHSFNFQDLAETSWKIALELRASWSHWKPLTCNARACPNCQPPVMAAVINHTQEAHASKLTSLKKFSYFPILLDSK